MKKNIFGKTFEVECSLPHEALVSETFALYSEATDSPVDVKIEIRASQLDDPAYLNNPKIHLKFRNGMETRFPQAQVKWEPCTNGRSVLRAVVGLSNCYQGGALRRTLSIEFPTCIEWFQQIIHELVLVPAVYFLSDRAPLHAACVAFDGKVVAFTGTGGVGKSSAMLALRRKSSGTFLSDDILVVDSSGKAYGNMAWPKIYGYNFSDSSLKAQVFSKRSAFDRLQFEIRCKIDSSRARRKVKPSELYGAVAPDGMRLTHVVGLIRTSGLDFEVEEMGLETLVKMSELVMLPEYAVFHQHLYWEEFNALASKDPPSLRMADVVGNWREVWGRCFENVCLKKVTVPVSMDQETLMRRIEKLVDEF